MRPRRDVLRALAGSCAALALGGAPGCARRGGGGRVEASFWFAYGGTTRDVLLALIEQFHASQSSYRIHAVHQGDYFELLAKLRTAIATRTAPALSHVVGEVIPYLAEAGALESIDSFTHGEDFGLLPALSQSGMFTGGADRPLWALPFNRSTPIAYYNKDVFRELDLRPPTTWGELGAVARAATKRGAGGAVERWGFECPVDWWFWAALVGQAGGQVIAADETPDLGGEAGVRALELWQRLVDEERVMKALPGRDFVSWQTANSDFLAERTAMIWTSTAYLRYLEKNAHFAVGAAPLPADVRFSVPTGGTMFVMPRGAPRPEQEAAFAFLRFMMAPAQANAWATRTGYIPISKAGVAELEQSGYYEAHPNDRVAMDQLAHAAPWPWAKNLFRVQREVVQPRLEEAVLGHRSARVMMDEARKAALAP